MNDQQDFFIFRENEFDEKVIDYERFHLKKLLSDPYRWQISILIEWDFFPPYFGSVVNFKPPRSFSLLLNCISSYVMSPPLTRPG